MSPIHDGSAFELTSFLEGRVFAWGIFEDRFGRVRRRFTVEMVGHWEERVFLLHERFTYDDGSHETRVWRVEPEGRDRFTATCPDCVGVARGECKADAVRISYTFRLKFDGRELHVAFDDRIYRVGEHLAVNRATMRKWGVRLGELSLFFQRELVGEPPRRERVAT
jgi:hypothetical protein